LASTEYNLDLTAAFGQLAAFEPQGGWGDPARMKRFAYVNF
jgi:hypothetical protein